MLEQIVKLRNIELRIAYAGGRYFGWQIQPNRPTVQGLLQHALRRILKETVRTVGASRTDTGVHAHDQRVSFQTASPIPLPALLRALIHFMPDDISILEGFERPADHSVRYHARAKHYSYLFYNGRDASPFFAPYMWCYGKPLDEALMARCAKYFEGTRCFKALQAARDHRIGTETTIFTTSVSRHGRVVCFDVTGHRFLYHMVRNMAGALLMVGTGEWDEAEFSGRLAEGDRTRLGVTAPASGLHLFQVYFDEPPYHRPPARDDFLKRLTL